MELLSKLFRKEYEALLDSIEGVRPKRYSRHAREALASACRLAHYNGGLLEPEHLLDALTEENKSGAFVVLREYGIRRGEIVIPGDFVHMQGRDLPLRPSSKTTMAVSAAFVRAITRGELTTGDLLFGLADMGCLDALFEQHQVNRQVFRLSLAANSSEN